MSEPIHHRTESYSDSSDSMIVEVIDTTDGRSPANGSR